MDDIIAKILGILRPHARQETTHPVGLAERVEALMQLQPKARHGELAPGFDAKWFRGTACSFMRGIAFLHAHPCTAWRSAWLATSTILAERHPAVCDR